MKPVKDNFSVQADVYARFRPRYPDALYNFLFGLIRQFTSAWDCGTGNGQVAEKLSDRFAMVYATDVSEEQLRKAVQKPNVRYVLTRAERTGLPDNSIDLVTVAQAIHWFDFDAFYSEVMRVAKPDAVVAAWAYNRITVSPSIDPIIDELYFHTLGPYWDVERKFVDESYTTIPFPFKEIETPQFHIISRWTLEQLVGYLNSWSGVQNYIGKRRLNPVDEIEVKISRFWRDDEMREVKFPIFMRIGKIEK